MSGKSHVGDAGKTKNILKRSITLNKVVLSFVT